MAHSSLRAATITATAQTELVVVRTVPGAPPSPRNLMVVPPTKLVAAPR